jgi:hypothetical protein
MILKIKFAGLKLKIYKEPIEKPDKDIRSNFPGDDLLGIFLCMVQGGQ